MGITQIVNRLLKMSHQRLDIYVKEYFAGTHIMTVHIDYYPIDGEGILGDFELDYKGHSIIITKIIGNVKTRNTECYILESIINK